MVCARLAAAVAAALVVALPTAAAHAAAPQNLHAFTLRADEAVTHTFASTPSFAWNPVPGATKYDFELSTSRNFSDSGIVWTTEGKAEAIKTPAAALPLSLPWITGNPYSLYAHVRAWTRRGVTPWSKPFGLNMRWPAVAKPLTPSYPGLLRWTKVPGASGYMVWLLDVGRSFTTRANMADEREYYTLHQDPAWTSTVHWRVRPMRWTYGATDNDLPRVSYGRWSPVYTSYNPPFSTGPLTALATVSDVVSDAGHTRTHETTPAFVYRGDTSIWGRSTGLYRVLVFTDEDCVNTVFRGPAIGSPAYVPREVGPHAIETELPPPGTLPAPGAVLSLNPEPLSKTADGITVTPWSTNELDPAGGDDASHVWPLPPWQPAKVDLWDNDWSGGGYYWTVMPVHVAADGTYVDSELTQDACASGRKLTFAKTSEPGIAGQAGTPFASGLSPRGTLAAASRPSPRFYGQPLVAWSPIASASQYEVQWSKKLYPWTTAGSQTTWSTSATLPLSPGTWYYRVRGVDYLRMGSKPWLSWSDPVRIVVTKPRFRVVR
jgi:hypothetical protein